MQGAFCVLVGLRSSLTSVLDEGIGFCEKGIKKSFLQGSHLSALFADTSLLILQKILAVALKLEAEEIEAVYHALGY